MKHTKQALHARAMRYSRAYDETTLGNGQLNAARAFEDGYRASRSDLRKQVGRWCMAFRATAILRMIVWALRPLR